MSSSNSSKVESPSRREKPLFRAVVDSLFRNWPWILGLWVLATLGAVGYLALSPKQYESEMTLLVRNSRAEVMMSAEGAPQAQERRGDITDAQLSTEVQTLSSRDLAVKLLPAAGFNGGSATDLEGALVKLRKNLQVAPVLKSSMIRVRYTADDPQRAASVLETLANLYLEQHVQLHGNSGSFEFFDAQTAEAGLKLKEAQTRLAGFQQSSGMINAAEQKDMVLQRQMELQVSLHQSEAELHETSRKIESIRPRLEALSLRVATQSRHVSNQYSVERLSTMLAELHNRRTELLVKYRPSERNVVQVDQQIADTEKAMKAAEARGATEEASDINPLRQNLESDLARAESTEAGLRGRIQAMRSQYASYRTQLTDLERYIPLEQQYQREAKVAEDNYLLYNKKREEALIGQRMDQQKIANVVLAERPRVPTLAKSRAGTVVGVYLLILALAVVFVLALSRTRGTVHTPWDLEAVAYAPVLGTVPTHAGRAEPVEKRSST